MSLHIASLNSGSNGNCYYIGNDQDAVLVDAGISCREVEKRMDNLGLALEKVKALFISHEHVDHIRGVSVLSKKYRLPVYITEGTYRHASIRVERELHYSFVADEPVAIGTLAVTPFEKHHDAKDPFSFVIEYNGIRAGVFTDIGRTCKRLIHYFKQCHACFLESNYDERMLEEGRYPQRLKNRIRGGHGHLSNAQALELFLGHRPPFLSHVLLSHLSEQNNDPEVALNLFTPHAGNALVEVASRYRESAVYTITRTDGIPDEKQQPAWKRMGKQLALFDLTAG